MKCEKCGFETNPGDQICINCGNKLPLTSITTVEEIENMNSTISNTNSVDDSKNNKKKLFLIIGVSLVLVIALVLVYFLVIRR